MIKKKKSKIYFLLFQLLFVEILKTEGLKELALKKLQLVGKLTNKIGSSIVAPKELTSSDASADNKTSRIDFSDFSLMDESKYSQQNRGTENTNPIEAKQEMLNQQKPNLVTQKTAQFNPPSIVPLVNLVPAKRTIPNITPLINPSSQQKAMLNFTKSSGWLSQNTTVNQPLENSTIGTSWVSNLVKTPLRFINDHPIVAGTVGISALLASLYYYRNKKREEKDLQNLKYNLPSLPEYPTNPTK